MRTDSGDLPTAVLATASSALRRCWTAELSGRLALVEAVDRVELEAVMLTTPRVVVFLDLALRGLNGLDGVSDLHKVNPGARIVLLASAPSDQEAVFALATGARGYCDRDIAPELVTKAAEVVQEGEIWIGRRVERHLLQRITSLTPTCWTRSPPDASPSADWSSSRHASARSHCLSGLARATRRSAGSSASLSQRSRGISPRPSASWRFRIGFAWPLSSLTTPVRGASVDLVRCRLVIPAVQLRVPRRRAAEFHNRERSCPL